MSPAKAVEDGINAAFKANGIKGLEDYWRSSPFKRLHAQLSEDERADAAMLKDELKAKATE